MHSTDRHTVVHRKKSGDSTESDNGTTVYMEGYGKIKLKNEGENIHQCYKQDGGCQINT